MKILVPLNSEECLEEYVEAGADELYMGFYAFNNVYILLFEIRFK